MPPLAATRWIHRAAIAGVLALFPACTTQSNPSFTAVDAATSPPPGDAAVLRDGPRVLDGPLEPPPGPDGVDGSRPDPAPDVAPQPDALPPDVAPDTAGPDALPADMAAPPVPVDAPINCQAPINGSGTGVRAEYFDNSDFTGKLVSRTDNTIDWDFGTGSADPSLDSDNFSARWTGQLQAVFSGPHTFYASYNDGMRMFLDERVVIYRWGPRLTTGEDRATVELEAGRRYDLRYEFYDQGSAAVARLGWSNTCQTARQAIPRRQLYPMAPAAPVCLTERPSGSGSGLKVEYFSGEPSPSRLLATGKDARVDFEWGTGSPASGVPADGFHVRWTGTLEAPIDGPLTIYLSNDDVGRIRFGGALIMDSWSEPFGPQEIAATVDVRAGQRYAVIIDHRDDQGGSFAHLYWSWPCRAREVVPSQRLYPP
jgi:hypothetical protein